MPYDQTDDILDVSSDEAILVEYLDGELTLKERQIVEERLAKESELRETLTRLEKSWQYLDLLERTDADKEAVEATLETVVLKTEEEVRQQENNEKRRKPWKRFAVVLLGLFLFFVASHVGWHHGDRNHWLRVAFPIIERFDMYRMLMGIDPDLELLRELARQRVFLLPLPEDADPVDPKEYLPVPRARIPDSNAIHMASPKEFERRVKRLEAFDSTRYSQFYRNYEKFEALDWDSKFKLKELHEEIAKAPRGDELFLSLQSFYLWFKSLQSYEKNELRQKKLTVSQRVEKIAALKTRLENHSSRSYEMPLVSPILESEDEGNLQQLSDALKEIPPRTLDDVLDASPEQILGTLHRMTEEKKSTSGLGR